MLVSEVSVPGEKNVRTSSRYAIGNAMGADTLEMSSTAMNTGSDFDYAAFERGADPDVRIEVTETDGVLDYTAYFDMDSISRIMDERHPAEEDAPSETAVVLTVAIAILAILLLLSGSGKKA